MPQVQPQYDDEIDLIELWNTLWAERKLLAMVTGAFAVGSVIISLMITNIYRAETLLMPIVDGQSTQLNAQLGFAASLAGVELDTGTDQAQIAIATLRSREFITKFIRDHDLLPWLFASKYRARRGESVIDPRLFDMESGTWRIEDEEPSDWSAYSRLSSVLTVNQGGDTGLVTVALEWPDPVFASQWVNLLVQDLNNYLRARDRSEASRAIEYLQGQLPTTNLVEMERMIYQLIESQTRILMLADVREDYRFQVIDPAFVPEVHISPNRRLIVILGTGIGGMLAVLWVLARQGWVNYCSRLIKKEA